MRRFRDLLTFDDEPLQLSRRGALLGLSAVIAAPFVIRTPGLLMPVRDRTIMTADELDLETMLGTRDWRKYPVALAEVKDWRASMNRLLDQRVFLSWTGSGWARNSAMIDAEKRFKARGLL